MWQLYILTVEDATENLTNLTTVTFARFSSKYITVIEVWCKLGYSVGEPAERCTELPQPDDQWV